MIRVNKRHTIEWEEGMTVQQVLDAMNYNYSLITVSVNNVLVPREEYDTYLVPDRAEVNVFHLAHGG